MTAWGASALIAWAFAVAPLAAAQASGGAAPIPGFRALVASVQGTYRDTSRSDAKGVETNQPKTNLAGTEVQIAGSYTFWEFELGNRLLSPKDTPWWSRRSESALSVSYHWPRFSYVQPVLGLTQMTQTGDQDHADAPPAFIDKNSAAILGLRSSLTLYSFGTHGFLGQGRLAYHTTLEKLRNFGDESYLGLGYFFATGRFRAALVAGQLRNFFRAEKPDPDVDEAYLVVRHTYVVNRIGLYMEY